ncbi:hypothetical protein [Legionella sp. CNM-4043-24]|uniref:hypothetical protein n=1 Tax=Legionella sp. CNM-4043-24 TaxID=3421646 RepID=UPI00403AE4A6
MSQKEVVVESHLQLFFDKLKDGLELEALAVLEDFFALYGVEEFLNFKMKISAVLYGGLPGNQVFSLLGWLVIKNHQILAKRLIDVGINLEEGVQYEADPYLHNQSPLMLACDESNVEMVRLLLEAGADITYTNTFGIGMLMVIKTAEICRMIVDHAIKNDCFNTLISQKTKEDNGAANYAQARNNSEVYLEIVHGGMRTLYHAIQQSETAALEQLEINMAEIGLVFSFFAHSQHGDDLQEYLLYSAARRNYLTLANRLLALKLSPIDAGIVCETVEPSLHATSPLGIACYFGHIDMMNLLIANGADLLKLTHENKSLLMLVCSVEAAEVLLKAAKEKFVLDELLMLGQKFNKDALSCHCYLGNADIVRVLMRIPYFERMMPIRTSLSHARLASIRFPEKSAEFDAICHQLRAYKSRSLARTWSRTSEAPRLTDCYYGLFGSRARQEATCFDAQKTEAIKSVIADFYQLLTQPARAIRCLQFLNDELCRYYSEKHGQAFPVLNSNMYQFIQIDDLYYPVPDPEYQPLQKNKALPELLIAILRQYGMAGKVSQWIGFVPNAIADSQVKQGDFVFEGEYGAGLFHGKLSHMLQRVILIYAIEQGEIDLSFEYDRVRHTLRIQDILEGLVSMDTNDGIRAWTTVQDMRTTTHVEFSDPHRLFSILMHDGRSIGCAALADSLIDSFCKGLRRYYQAWKKNTPFTEVEMAEFLRHQEDLTLETFNLMPALIRAELEETSRKRQLQIDAIAHSEKYALIPKNYQPREQFVPETCSAFRP